MQTPNGSRFVDCPVCSQRVAHYLINSHLDYDVQIDQLIGRCQDRSNRRNGANQESWQKYRNVWYVAMSLSHTQEMMEVHFLTA